MNKTEQIKHIVEELLKKLSFEGIIQVIENEHSYQIQVKLENDQSLLIGQAGTHLQAFQHIVRLTLRKQIAQEENFKEVYLDVNGYWEEKEQKLADDARIRAAEVLATGEEQTLPFMEAHDRRVVHAALVAVEGVQTESFGFGKERRMRIFVTNKEEALKSLSIGSC